jgi:archaellum biogenesis ATPase FlaH
VLAAKPNAGKTALMTDIAALMVKAGKEVSYVNADASGSDTKAYHYHAVQHGYSAAFPSMAVDGSMTKVVDQLRGMAATSADLTKQVLIFDTLKKMTDVIQKKQLRELLDLLRRLTAMGATVICLGHCNKYRDAEGNLIYEGTGDLEADVDELIYLESGNDPLTGKKVISTYLQKVRSAIEPISFEMGNDKYRTCTQLPEFIDIKATNITSDKERKLVGDNQWLISKVSAALLDGELSLTELKDKLSGSGMGVNKLVKLVKQMNGIHWDITRHPDANNMLMVRLKQIWKPAPP